MNCALSLFELNNLVRSVLEQTLTEEYWLEAELSEARLASNGHMYVEFVQKDVMGSALVARARGTIWARTYNMLAPLFERTTGQRLRAGMKVRVLVTIVFHELYGYSLNVVNIDPAYTLGDIAARRREILSQLTKDGIAEDNRGLSLPRLLRRIAVVSSASAAGYGDFCDQLQHNDYGLAFTLRLFPAVMQGANVEESVLAALEAIMAEAEEWDCVVIIRGGGATSDLSDFDTYPLAAAVAQMPIPVIVGIGHERDETVLDYVAHTRVKTPTAAAALLIAHGAAELEAIEELRADISQHALLQLQKAKTRLTTTATVVPRAARLVCENQRHRLQQLLSRTPQAAQKHIITQQHRLHVCREMMTLASHMIVQKAAMHHNHLQQRLALLDPLLPLRRGYSITYAPDGSILRSADALLPGQTITTRLAEGTIKTQLIKLKVES